MLCTHVEDCLVFVIAKFEVLFGAVEVLDEHINIVVLQCVIQRQVAVVIANIRPWSNFVHDWVLLHDADNVFNGLSFVVLLTTSSEKLIITTKPAKDLLISVTSTNKERILSQVVFLLQRFILEVCKYLQHLHVLLLHSNEQGVSAEVVWMQAPIRTHIKEVFGKLMLASTSSQVQWSVAVESISAVKDVNVRELVRIEQVVDNFCLFLLNSCEEASLT